MPWYETPQGGYEDVSYDNMLDFESKNPKAKLVTRFSDPDTGNTMSVPLGQEDAVASKFPNATPIVSYYDRPQPTQGFLKNVGGSIVQGITRPIGQAVKASTAITGTGDIASAVDPYLKKIGGGIQAAGDYLADPTELAKTKNLPLYSPTRIASGIGEMAPSLAVAAAPHILGLAGTPETGGASEAAATLWTAGVFGVPSYSDMDDALEAAGIKDKGIRREYSAANAVLNGIMGVGQKAIAGGKLLAGKTGGDAVTRAISSARDKLAGTKVGDIVESAIGMGALGAGQGVAMNMLMDAAAKDYQKIDPNYSLNRIQTMKSSPLEMGAEQAIMGGVLRPALGYGEFREKPWFRRQAQTPQPPPAPSTPGTVNFDAIINAPKQPTNTGFVPQEDLASQFMPGQGAAEPISTWRPPTPYEQRSGMTQDERDIALAQALHERDIINRQRTGIADEARRQQMMREQEDFAAQQPPEEQTQGEAYNAIPVESANAEVPSVGVRREAPQRNIRKMAKRNKESEAITPTQEEVTKAPIDTLEGIKTDSAAVQKAAVSEAKTKPIKTVNVNGKPVKVMAVDGESVRDNYLQDFTAGGHNLAGDKGQYKFIPKDEIWVEKNLKGKDLAATIEHERSEMEAMEKGVPYEKAHESANVVEKSVRSGETKPVYEHKEKSGLRYSLMPDGKWLRTHDLKGNKLAKPREVTEETSSYLDGAYREKDKKAENTLRELRGQPKLQAALSPYAENLLSRANVPDPIARSILFRIKNEQNMRDPILKGQVEQELSRYGLKFDDLFRMNNKLSVEHPNAGTVGARRINAIMSKSPYKNAVVVLKNNNELNADQKKGLGEVLSGASKGTEIPGFYDPVDGKIYLIGSKFEHLKSDAALDAAIKKMLKHEVEVHFSLDKLFSNNERWKFSELLHLDKQMSKDEGWNQDLRQVAKDYGFNLNVRDERAHAVNELLARMNEQTKEPNWYGKVVEWLKNFFRTYFNTNLGDSEAIAMLRQLRATAKKEARKLEPIERDAKGNLRTPEAALRPTTKIEQEQARIVAEEKAAEPQREAELAHAKMRASLADAGKFEEAKKMLQDELANSPEHREWEAAKMKKSELRKALASARREVSQLRNHIVGINDRLVKYAKSVEGSKALHDALNENADAMKAFVSNQPKEFRSALYKLNGQFLDAMRKARTVDALAKIADNYSDRADRVILATHRDLAMKDVKNVAKLKAAMPGRFVDAANAISDYYGIAESGRHIKVPYGEVDTAKVNDLSSVLENLAQQHPETQPYVEKMLDPNNKMIETPFSSMSNEQLDTLSDVMHGLQGEGMAIKDRFEIENRLQEYRDNTSQLQSVVASTLETKDGKKLVDDIRSAGDGNFDVNKNGELTYKGEASFSVEPNGELHWTGDPAMKPSDKLIADAERVYGRFSDRIKPSEATLNALNKKAGQWWRNFWAEGDKVRELIAMLDGAKDGLSMIEGSFYKNIYRPLSEATKTIDARKSVWDDKYNAILSKHGILGDGGKSLRDFKRKVVDTVGHWEVTPQMRMAVYSHMKNAQNLKSLTGYFGNEMTPGEARRIVAGITEQEKAIADDFLKELPQLYDEMYKVFERMGKTPPDRVNGVYYPMMKAKEASRQVGGGNFDVNAMSTAEAILGDGFTKSRSEFGQMVLDLDFFDAMDKHFGDVNRFIALAEPFDRVKNNLLSKSTRQLIAGRLGIEGRNQFEGWLKDIARPNYQLADEGTFSRFLRFLRQRAVVSVLAYRVSTVMSQFSQAFQAVPELGADNLRLGFTELAKDWAKAKLDIEQNSAAIKERSQGGFDKDIKNAIVMGRGAMTDWEKMAPPVASALKLMLGEVAAKKAGQKTSDVLYHADVLQKRLGEIGMKPIIEADKMICCGVWLGAKHKAINEMKARGENPSDPANLKKIHEYADDVVRRTQSSTRSVDTSEWGRGGELMRTAMTLNSFFNSTYNLLHRDVKKFREGTLSKKEFAGHMFWMVAANGIAATMVDTLLHGDATKDGYLKAMLQNTASSAFVGIPGIANVANSIFKGYSPRILSLQSIEKFGGAGLPSGTPTEKQMKNFADGMFAITGLPKQALDTTFGAYDVMQGQSLGGYDSLRRMLAPQPSNRFRYSEIRKAIKNATPEEAEDLTDSEEYQALSDWNARDIQQRAAKKLSDTLSQQQQ